MAFRTSDLYFSSKILSYRYTPTSEKWHTNKGTHCHTAHKSKIETT